MTQKISGRLQVAVQVLLTLGTSHRHVAILHPDHRKEFAVEYGRQSNRGHTTPSTGRSPRDGSIGCSMIVPTSRFQPGWLLCSRIGPGGAEVHASVLFSKQRRVGRSRRRPLALANRFTFRRFSPRIFRLDPTGGVESFDLWFVATSTERVHGSSTDRYRRTTKSSQQPTRSTIDRSRPIDLATGNDKEE